MMKVALAALLLSASQAYAVDLSGIPQNCQAPLAHDMEMRNIPYFLDLQDSSATIISIETIGGSEAYQYYPNLWRIDCFITVHWSNGIVDAMYKFSVWEDRYGDLKGTYSQH